MNVPIDDAVLVVDVDVVPAVGEMWDVVELGRENGLEVNGLAVGAGVVIDWLVAAVVLFHRAGWVDSGGARDREGDECACAGYEGTFRASIVAVIVIDS